MFKQPEVAPPLDELDKLLLLWREWMERGGGIVRGFSFKSMCFVGSGKNSSEDFTDAADISTATIMDAIINDLPVHEKAAINHKYLGARYFYHIGTYVEVLDRAMSLISKAAEKRGLI